MFVALVSQIDVEKKLPNGDYLMEEAEKSKPSYAADVPVFMDGYVFLPLGYLSRVFGPDDIPFPTVRIKDCLRAIEVDYENWLVDLHGSLCKFLEEQ